MIAQLIAALIALIKDMPWSMRVMVVIASLALGAAWYSYSSKQEAVAAAKVEVAEAQQQVAATDNDKQNLRIENTDKLDAVKGELCACRVALARAEIPKPVQPKVVVRRIPVKEPELESCE